MERGDKRILREKKTVHAMVELYCRSRHRCGLNLCQECSSLLEYSRKRLDACPFIKDKPTCAKCPIHCYEKTKRARMREVMRFSGPRMITRHPLMAIRHMVDGRRRTVSVKKEADDG